MGVLQIVIVIVVENHVIILWQAVYDLQFYCTFFADVVDYEATVIVVADIIFEYVVVDAHFTIFVIVVNDNELSWWQRQQME